MNATSRGVRPRRDTWVAAIHSTPQDVRPLGSGFLIDSRRVLTCAHVVRPTWDKKGDLWVAFPKAEEVVEGRLRVSAVSLPADDQGIRDVAVLHLTEDVPSGLAARLRRAAPGDLVGTKWWSFGFPEGALGNSASGTVGEELAHGWVRLDTDESRYPVKGGYSGAAVWSPDFQAVVGMVGQAHTTTGDALALTVREIDRLLPEEKLCSLTEWSLNALDETPLTSWGWTLDTDPEAGRHWRPRARGVSTDAEQGFRFRGRTAVLRDVTAWITATPPSRQALVITGAPGSGKSAVLGRIITTADRDVAASLPPEDTAVRAPLGSVACAVHTKGKTALEVAQEIARAASAPPPRRVADLLPSLRECLRERHRHPFTLVIDALDEATSPADARAVVSHIVVPLAETCADLGARVMVGTRRRDDAGDLLGAFGQAAHVLDLDSPEFSALSDLTAYTVATLQLQGDERSGSPYSDLRAALPLAERIAALADGNFLVAGLVARTHGLHDVQAADPRKVTFPVTVDASLREYLHLLPNLGTLTAEKLLVPLAHAESPGLPLPLWRTALTALFGTAPTEDELLSFARSSAANFLVESTGHGPDGIAFQLFHQALNEALRAMRADMADLVRDERALARALLSDGVRHGWARAHPYLLRSLAGHARRGGVIDEVLSEDDYPLYADLRRLIPQAQDASTSAARRRAELLRRTPRAIDAPPPERAALFSVTEVQERLGTTYRSHAAAAPYQAVWSTAPPSPEVAVLEGHDRQVDALCFVDVGERGVLASADGASIRLWDVATGDTLHTLEGRSERWLSALCAVPVSGRTLLASGEGDGSVRLWDASVGALVRTLTGHDAPVVHLCAIAISERTFLVSAGHDGRVLVRDPENGDVLSTFPADNRRITGVGALELDGSPVVAIATAFTSRSDLIRIWDPVTGATLRTFDVDDFESARSDVIRRPLVPVPGPNGPLLATFSGYDCVRLWDPQSGKTERIMTADDWLCALSTVRTRNGLLLAVGYGGDGAGGVMLLDPSTGEKVHCLDGHGEWVGAVCAARSQGELLLASAGGDYTVRLWDLDRSPSLEDHDDVGVWPTSLCSLKVRDRMLVADNGLRGGSLRIHDVATGRLVDRVDSGHEAVSDFCPVRFEDHDCLAIAGRGGGTPTVQIWDPLTAVTTQALTGLNVRRMCPVEVDGRPCLAVAVRDGETYRISVWDPASREMVRTVAQETDVNADTLCPIRVAGRNAIATLRGGGNGAGRVTVWDMDEGALITSWDVPDEAISDLFELKTEGGALLAVKQQDGTEGDDDFGSGTLWGLDPLTGRKVLVCALHSGWVNEVRPVKIHGRRLVATAGLNSRSVGLWASDTLEPLADIPVRRGAHSVVEAVDHLVVGLDHGLIAVRIMSESIPVGQ
ncbi:trypsin-like peptidase domain-containing protein [Streptomyces ureilyticus]|uniref:AAA family ATPase n=1 Tax=Streptomyces ureilyticus TaxID=1775131 RepID=A0ABX0DXP6_9ACTN|nr:trypsin-like peptidase domain-containing protein [Streptomyces ureilyticus]NGO46706.1 AAA family ATPase [Streptomyces ureilyticus]